MADIVNKYENTICYKIVCKDDSIKDTYIGHTVDFQSRLKNHKCNCHNSSSKEYNHKIYQFIRANGGFENWSVQVIETYNCKNRNEAKQHEQMLIKQHNSSLNTTTPGRTNQEWLKDNREKMIQYRKAYRAENLQYMTQRDTQYYLLNRDQIRERRKQTVECPYCKCLVQTCVQARHNNTKKHQVALSRTMKLEYINVI